MTCDGLYNEIDPYAAQWLRNLIDAGCIAPGVVDERPIQEIEAWENCAPLVTRSTRKQRQVFLETVREIVDGLRPVKEYDL